MRTKTLLLAAVALAVGMMTTQAQTVFSANVVGYVNLNMVTNLPYKYNFVANQLDYDGSGRSNTVVTVFGTNMPTPTYVYAWLPASAIYAQAEWEHTVTGNKWVLDTNDVNAALQPGGAVFVVPPTNFTLTMVGTVLQNTNWNISLTPGVEVALGDPVPLSGYLTTNLNYQPNMSSTANKDYVYIWDPVGQTFNQYEFLHTVTGWHWTPSSPIISVGQGFFLTPGATNNWNVSFTVQ
jgi:hypothetical protein